jgi:hypothetical protein
MKKWHQNNKDERRRSNLKHKYNMTEEQYQTILQEQNGTCAICQWKQDYNLSVDHCHDTGIIRGLLCAKCNRGLGLFEDNIETMKSAINYLQKTQTGIVHVHLTVRGKTFNEEKKETERNTSRDLPKSTRASDCKATQEGDE